MAEDDTHSDDRSTADRQNLRWIGLIATLTGPASAAAALAQLLNISGQRAAYAFMAAFLISGILVLRRFFDRCVPASLTVIAAILISLPVGLYGNVDLLFRGVANPPAGAENAVLQHFPRANDFLSADGDPSLAASIKSSNEEIWFYGIAFYISADDMFGQLMDALRRGVSIRYLVFDCDGEYVEEVARTISDAPEGIGNLCSTGTFYMTQLQRAWAEEKGSSLADVHIRYYNEVPHGRAYIFDPDSLDASGYFIPYVTGVDSANLPGFFVAEGQDVVNNYVRGLRKLWEESSPDIGRENSADGVNEGG